MKNTRPLRRTSLAALAVVATVLTTGTTSAVGNRSDDTPRGPRAALSPDELARDRGQRTVRLDRRQDCTQPAVRRASERAPATGVEGSPDTHWAEDELVRAAIERVEQAITDHPDLVLSSYIDFEKRRLIVLVDPTMVSQHRTFATVVGEYIGHARDDVRREHERIRELDRTRLDASERAALDEGLRSGAPPHAVGEGSLDIVIRRGCRSVADLAAAEAHASQWIEDHARLAPADFGVAVAVDPHTARLMFILPTAAIELTQAVRAEFGEGVDIRHLDLRAEGRLDDGSPHYGGALIRNRSFGWQCTAGFAVDRDGGRWMTTAAHCATGNGTFFDSGPHYYGVSQHRNSNTDTMLIGSGYEVYSRVIHVDPCSPCTRLVTAKKWQLTTTTSGLCVSGAFSKAKCGISVFATTGSYCYPTDDGSGGMQCAKDVAFVERSTPFHQSGDSGAPVYIRNGSGTARIAGLHVAGDEAGLVGLVVMVKRVQSSTGSKVAIACCNNTSW